jgi:hypothetical protein
MKNTNKNYTRTPILNWYELTQEQQNQVDKEEDGSHEETSYVEAFSMVIGLNMFMRYDNPIWNGAMHLTNTSGLLIKVNRTNEEALVKLVCY